MRRRDQRLMMISAAGAVLVLAAALTFAGLRDSIVYFVAPSELAQKAHAGQRIRLGGLVVAGTVHRVKAGELILMPADKPHGLQAVGRFKMMLTMIRS